MKKLVIIITIIGFSLTLLGIIKQVDTRAVKIENIEIAQSRTLEIGQETKIDIKITPNGASNKKIIWKSSNPDIVDIDEDGNVFAYSDGKATITVSSEDGSIVSTCVITVKKHKDNKDNKDNNADKTTNDKEDTEGINNKQEKDKSSESSKSSNKNENTKNIKQVNSVTLNHKSVTVVNGMTVSLKAAVSPSNAENKNVSWTSSNTSVATVSSSGVVTAKSVGTATITVTTEDGSKKAACEVTVTPIRVSGVTLSSSTISMVNGNISTLTATVSPSNAANKNVTWTSSNTSVATVSSSGVVTAKSVGTTTITVTTEDGSKKATCLVTVTPIKVSGVTLNSSTISIVNGNNMILTATVSPSNAANKNVSWTSSNTSVATVSSTGVVTAKSVGTATITVTTEDGSKKATCLVIVEPIKVSQVTLSSNAISIINGNTMTLTAAVSPSNAENKNVTWTSSNTSVATVSSTGVVTAKSVGTATITVTTEDGSKKATCEVMVTPIEVSGVSLNTSSVSIVNGSTSTLTATVSPSNAENKNVTWTSSNTSVATVSSTGVVTAKSVGTATITVTTEDGSKKATCEVTVTPIRVSGVTLGSSSEEIVYLNNKTLIATVSPSNAANKNVTWSSSNTSVATVSSTGVVTAKSVGTATITVTTEDGNKKATTNITVKPLPIVYFVAHQDDETISASGFILEDLKSGSNVDVHVYLCTDGAGSGVYTQIINGQTKITGKNASNFTRADFSEARDKEYIAALQKLGVNKNNIHILKYTNNSGTLTRFEDGKLKDNKSKLKTVLNDEIKKYTNPAIRAHIPLLTQILSISKSEGKNHYHKDHVTIGNVIYELYSSNTALINMSENDIHNLRFFTDENWTDSDYETTEFKSRYKKYPQTLTSSDKEKWNNARNEYERFEPDNGRYSIGGLSVESQFVSVKNRMDNKGYLNHYFTIGTLYKNNLVTTSTDY